MGTPARRLTERVALVVDDEVIVCRYTARVLTAAGLRVLEAYDGQEAMTLLELLGSTAVGLVVSDVAMPRMGGVELAMAIGQRWPAIPVLLVSGQGGSSSAYPGAFLGKPFTPDALVASVESLLGSLPLRTINRQPGA
jgi:two-component system, cell cycle sensor histidine kinase and response regulator CckA